MRKSSKVISSSSSRFSEASSSRLEEPPKISPVEDNELPPEFKKYDKPLGIDKHILNLMFIGVLTHSCLFYYLFYLWPLGIVPRWTALIAIAHIYMIGLGTTVGSHRYWTHKTFKASLPLQTLLMLLQTGGLQLPIFIWCRDHRLHHKFTDSNADPYSSHRGFWFSHITWLFQPTHPECLKHLKTVDMSDLARDPVVRFQAKYYWPLVTVTFYLVPMAMYHLIFPEMSLFHLNVLNFARYGVSLHVTFLVNSAAHLWGDKPYDKYISAVENTLVSFLANGEGWHNYHHTFPWDYKAAEYGCKYNFSTLFIHTFARIGWAWDLKTVSQKLLIDRINRTGDGSSPFHNHHHHHQHSHSHDRKKDKQFVDEEEEDKAVLAPAQCWGWGDKELRKEDLEITETVYPAKNCRG